MHPLASDGSLEVSCVTWKLIAPLPTPHGQPTHNPVCIRNGTPISPISLHFSWLPPHLGHHPACTPATAFSKHVPSLLPLCPASTQQPQSINVRTALSPHNTQRLPGPVDKLPSPCGVHVAALLQVSMRLSR